MISIYIYSRKLIRKSKRDNVFRLLSYQSSSSFFSVLRVTRSLVLCVMFCRSLFVLLSFFFWPLCSLSFFDLLILITPLYLQTLLNINLCLRHNNPLPQKFQEESLGTRSMVLQW